MIKYWQAIIEMLSRAWQWVFGLFVYCAMFVIMIPMSFVNTVIYCYSKILFTLTGCDNEDYFQMCERLGYNTNGYGTVYLCRNTLISFVKLTPKSKSIQGKSNKSKGVTIEERMMITAGLLMSVFIFSLFILNLLLNLLYIDIKTFIGLILAVNFVIASVIIIKRMFKLND